MNGPSVRIAAWRALEAGGETPLRNVEEVARERGIEGRDKALLRALVGQALRRRGTLDALMRAYAFGTPQADLARHLHLGLVQLFLLDRIPAHAAVDETVEAVGQTMGAKPKSYANAVLRAALRARREGYSGDPRRDLAGRNLHLDRFVFHDPHHDPYRWAQDALSMPAVLVERWERAHGWERAIELCWNGLSETELSLRVMRGERDAMVEELREQGVESKLAANPRALRCEAQHTEAVLASEAFREGRLSVQGESAQAAAEMLSARAGEELLDLCAAPGGKTAVLAESGARVLACDLDERRLKRLVETIERLGLAERVERISAAALRDLDPARSFDGVLIDAPCTNTGVLAARPEARWRFDARSLQALVALQEQLIEQGAARTKAGGRLVWSTCSLEAEEGAAQVQAFLARHCEWSLAEEQLSLPVSGGSPSDGGYRALLRKAP